MGMPNAYKCEICSDKYFPGTPQGHQELQRHYEMSADHNSPVPNEMKAYQCHIGSCGKYEDTSCDIIEHYRTSH